MTDRPRKLPAPGSRVTLSQNSRREVLPRCTNRNSPWKLLPGPLVSPAGTAAPVSRDRTGTLPVPFQVVQLLFGGRELALRLPEITGGAVSVPERKKAATEVAARHSPSEDYAALRWLWRVLAALRAANFKPRRPLVRTALRAA